MKQDPVGMLARGWERQMELPSSTTYHKEFGTKSSRTAPWFPLEHPFQDELPKDAKLLVVGCEGSPLYGLPATPHGGRGSILLGVDVTFGTQEVGSGAYGP